MYKPFCHSAYTIDCIECTGYDDPLEYWFKFVSLFKFEQNLKQGILKLENP